MIWKPFKSSVIVWTRLRFLIAGVILKTSFSKAICELLSIRVPFFWFVVSKNQWHSFTAFILLTLLYSLKNVQITFFNISMLQQNVLWYNINWNSWILWTCYFLKTKGWKIYEYIWFIFVCWSGMQGCTSSCTSWITSRGISFGLANVLFFRETLINSSILAWFIV